MAFVTLSNSSSSPRSFLFISIHPIISNDASIFFCQSLINQTMRERMKRNEALSPTHSRFFHQKISYNGSIKWKKSSGNFCDDNRSFASVLCVMFIQLFFDFFFLFFSNFQLSEYDFILYDKC